MQSHYDAELFTVLAASIVPAMEAALELTPWGGGKISWGHGARLSHDGVHVTHRSAEGLVRSDVLTREAIVGLWMLLGPLGEGEREDVTELVATRWGADGQVIAHASLLWQRIGERVLTIATRAQLHVLLGLSPYTKEVPA